MGLMHSEYIATCDRCGRRHKSKYINLLPATEEIVGLGWGKLKMERDRRFDVLEVLLCPQCLKSVWTEIANHPDQADGSD